MTAHRRVIEDRADEAGKRAVRPYDDAELAGIRADMELALHRMARLLNRYGGHARQPGFIEHVEVAHAMLSDELLGGHWFLAEQASGRGEG